MKETYLIKLAKYYSSLKSSDMPFDVLNKTRRVFIDFLSCLAVGAQVSEFAGIWNAYVIGLSGREEATILGKGKKVPAMNAAAAMGIMAHAIELDDGHRWGTSHPSVAVIPAVIAVGEREKSSFPDMLSAMIIGYDVMLRSARAINPSHLKRGFHSTGTCGSLGAAAGCAHLLKLDAAGFGHAISLGGLQSAGLQEMLHDNPGIKPLQPGKAAMAGVLAADLAKLGARGPGSLYEGEHGWLKAMCGNEYSRAALTDNLGSRWEIMLTYTKLYPTCRHCHAAIDLARMAKKDLQCTIEQIKKIEISTYSLGFFEVGRIVYPENLEEAMFSLAFSVTLAFELGNVRLADYTDATIADPRLKKLAAKVSIKIDEEMDAKYPEERGARMRVLLKDGRIFDHKIPIAKGEPENPVNDDDYLIKFQDMLAPYYPGEFLKGLWEIAIEEDLGSASYRKITNHFGRYEHVKEERL